MSSKLCSRVTPQRQLSGEMAQWETRLLNKPDDLSVKRANGGKREPTSKMCALVCSLRTYVYTLAHTHTIIIGVVMNNKQKF